MVEGRHSNARTAILAGWCLFLLATTAWLPWDTVVETRVASDMASYETIARAAPSLPEAAVQRQHAERFATHYAVGLLADGTGLELRATYRLLSLILLAAALAAVAALIAPLPFSVPAYAAVVGTAAATPYAFRFFLVAPAMLADLVFVLGVALLLLGLLRARPGLSLAAVVLAVLARQTAVLLWPAVAVAVITLPRWQRHGARLRWTTVAACAVVPLAVYAGLRAAAGPFARPHVEAFGEITIVESLAALPDGVGALGAHVARIVLGLLPPLVLLASALLRRPRRLPPEAVVALALAAPIVIQTLLLSPAWVGANAARLSALAAVPLAVAAGYLLASVPPLGPIRAGVIVAGLAGLSLHHVYAAVGPRSSAEFAALTLTAAALVFAALATHGRRSPAPGAATP